MRQTLICLLVLFAGCASNGPKYVVDESVVENIPQHEKLNLVDSKKAIENAVTSKSKADMDLERAEKALSEAEKGKETAKKELEIATLSVQTAETGYTLAKKRLNLAKLNQQNMKKEIFATQNQHELEKAKLVQQKGIKMDEDFSLRNFETATLEAKKDSTDSQLEATKLAKDIEDLNKKYMRQTEEYLEARNR